VKADDARLSKTRCKGEAAESQSRLGSDKKIATAAMMVAGDSAAAEFQNSGGRRGTGKASVARRFPKDPTALVV